MNCPKCGAKLISGPGYDGYVLFECLSFIYKTGKPLQESDPCLRNQLATVTAERDAALAELGMHLIGWRELRDAFLNDPDHSNDTIEWAIGLLDDFAPLEATAEKGAGE